MKIIKQGVVEKPKLQPENEPEPKESERFECNNCGCVFETDEAQSEYQEYHEFVWKKCPCCKRIVSKCVDGEAELKIKPAFGASFHGETWYTCASCGNAFEFYQALDHHTRCPHCNVKLLL